MNNNFKENDKNLNCDFNGQTAHDHHEHDHQHTFQEELMHHSPYAVFSVALGLLLLSLLNYSTDYLSLSQKLKSAYCSGYHLLFHSFHFLHVLFAATGTVVTFSRFSKKQSLIKTLLVGTISPTFFCLLSDVLAPYLAGVALGVPMELHICYHQELHNVLPFLLVGVVNGIVLSYHHSSMLKVFSLSSHFVHILISSLASLFYMVSHGFYNWYPQMGFVFLFLVIAVVVPCTFSDIIVPMYFAGVKKR